MTYTPSYEDRIEFALQAVLASGLNPKGWPALSLHSAAEQFGVSHTTLTARFHGRKTCTEAHVHQQQLSPSQEEVLKAWIKAEGRRGIPMSPSTVAQTASTISSIDVSENWIERFRDRHPDLKAKWSSGLECCHATALNRTNVSGFFQLLQELFKEYDIHPSNLYNMDEKGV